MDKENLFGYVQWDREIHENWKVLFTNFSFFYRNNLVRENDVTI